MSGGGGGGSGEQRYNWNDTLAGKWQPLLDNAVDVVREHPYEQYPMQRIAGFSPAQEMAMNATQDWASAGGTGPAIAGKNQAERTLNGYYQTGGAGANPYGGMNSPYFTDMTTRGLNDISEAFKQGTSADTTRMMKMAGAFGGSAHANKMANDSTALAKGLGNYMAGMQNDQYNRSGGYFEGERGRQAGMVPMGYGADDQFIKNMQTLMGVGDAQRSLEQDQLNMHYNDWQEQNNWDYKGLDFLSGLFGRAQGGMSPNMTYTTPGYAASPFSQLLGGAAMAYGSGMFG